MATNRSPNKPFRGVFTAIVTPFLKDGAIDWNGFDHLVKNQIKANVSGIVPCGTTGESPTLSKEEKLKLIEKSVELCDGRILVIAGTGSNSTADTVEFTKLACSKGADAALVVVPYYNKPSQSGLEAHYLAVAEASTIPIFLYNVPGRTGISLTAATVGKLAKHPRIIGIKEASGNLALLTEIRRAVRAQTNKEFIYLTGDDPTLAPFLASGGDGVISVASNILPQAVGEICRFAEKGDWKEAFFLHETLYEFFNNLFVEANPVPCKSLLAWNGLIEDSFRLPLTSMSTENAAKLKKTWEQIPAKIKEEFHAS